MSCFCSFLLRFVATVVAFRVSLFVSCAIDEEMVTKVRMAPPFPIEENIASNPDYVDEKRFAEILDAKSVKEFLERNGMKQLTADVGWRKLWRHWGGRGCFTTVVTHPNLDMPYISSEEEEVYFCKLGELVDVLKESSQEELELREFCCFYWPYGKL